MIFRTDLDLIQPAENVAIGAASVQSTAAPAGTTHVRISAVGNCHVRFDGTNPTAVAGDILIPLGHADVFKMTPGYKVAVIQDAASTGNCNIAFLRR